MRQIPLTQGKTAIVDDEDYPLLVGYNWIASRQPGGRWYALCWPTRLSSLFMHRLILEITDPKVLTDHKDGNGLNNQRVNLRRATTSQNAMNRGRQRNNKSGYKGVRCRLHGGGKPRWEAYITSNQKTETIGQFGSPEDAALAYDRKALELHGEFANLNFRAG